MSEWIENTGTQPVDSDVLVDVKFSDDGIEDINEGSAAGEWWWDGTSGIGSIIEWRLHGATPECESSIAHEIDSIIQALVKLKEKVCN